jgi:hypothetical protein
MRRGGQQASEGQGGMHTIWFIQAQTAARGRTHALQCVRCTCVHVEPCVSMETNDSHTLKTWSFRSHQAGHGVGGVDPRWARVGGRRRAATVARLVPSALRQCDQVVAAEH